MGLNIAPAVSSSLAGPSSYHRPAISVHSEHAPPVAPANTAPNWHETWA